LRVLPARTGFAAKFVTEAFVKAAVWSCVERGPRRYNMEPRDHMRRPGVELYNREHFRRPGMEHHRPGVEVEINR